VQTLKEANAYDDTVILFTSDHGDYLGDHALCYKGTFPCDADTRVPLVFKCPGLASSRCDQLIGNVDVMPTLLAAAGVEVPTTCQGFDLRPYLANGKAPRNEIVIYNEPGPTYRLRTAEWAYVFRPGGRDQLYHLSDDPHELNNLADRPAQASQLRLMQRRLTAWFVHHPGPCQEAPT
jgi:choline-sulfatase